MNNKEVSEQLLQAAQLLRSAVEKLQTEESKSTQAEQQETEPDIQRVPFDKSYRRIAIDSNGKATVTWKIEHNSNIDEWRFTSNNYFADAKTAQSLADKINFLMELQRYHDIYCPDFVPDWNELNTDKYCIYFHHSYGEFMYNGLSWCESKETVYFPSSEIAQKVCDRLNKKYGYIDKEKE